MLPNEYQQSMETAYQRLNETGIKKVKNPNIQQFLVDAFNAFFTSHQLKIDERGFIYLTTVNSNTVAYLTGLDHLCEYMSTEQTEIFDPGQLFVEESETHRSQKKITIKVENLDCPHCGTAHFDTDHWAEKPHQTHLCQSCHKTFEGTVKGVSRPIFTSNFIRNLCIEYVPYYVNL